MTDYERPTDRPAVGTFFGYDHIHILASNAFQAATWYCIRFGFEIVAYRGLSTGSRDLASWVLRKEQLTFVISSPLSPKDDVYAPQIAISGDHVHDVSFAVADVEALFEKAISRGAVAVHSPQTLQDEHGEVIIAKIKTYGNVNHTFIQRNNYTGVFMPGYQPYTKKRDPVLALLPDTKLQFLDHIVGNQADHQMDAIVEWYERVLDFHRFWSVDDSQICTEYSSLRSIVLADFDETVRFPINEPADGLRKSQITEFVEFHGVVTGIGGDTHGLGGAGVQHVALRTNDILASVAALRQRGVEFLDIPDSYYTDLKKRLAKSPTKIQEDLDHIQKLGILVDFDDNGYLLQLFTKPAQDRPTLFYEIIQRHNHNGFGVGNFRALFVALELEQEKRGNL